MSSNIETISILRDFHKITGARISIHDLYMNEIYCYPQSLSEFCEQVQHQGDVIGRCIAADKAAFEHVEKTGEPYTYRCHCGLIETVAPIFHYGVLSGYFMMGQFTDDSNQSIKEIENLSSKYFDDSALLKRSVNSIPRCESGLIESYLNILAVIAEYMTDSNRVAPGFSGLAENIYRYVNENYRKDLSVKALCGVFGCSRTTLMNSFRKKYGQTLGTYITKLRTEKAAEILTNGSSVKAAALNSGFSDQNYFTKVFSKQYGITPSGFSKKICSKEK